MTYTDNLILIIALLVSILFIIALFATSVIAIFYEHEKDYPDRHIPNSRQRSTTDGGDIKAYVGRHDNGCLFFGYSARLHDGFNTSQDEQGKNH